MDKQNKPIIMITFRENAVGSGPYQSHLRIINSSLKNKYKFVPLFIPGHRLGVLNIKVIRKMATDIKTVSPDIVHFTGLELVGWYGMLACKISKQKNSLMVIRGSSEEAIEFNKNKIKKYAIKVIEYLTMKNTRYSYGVSKYVSSWIKIKKNCSHYLGYVYNLPGDMDVKQSYFRKETGLNEKDILIVSTGRIEKEKGFEVLKNIICGFEWGNNVKFAIVGDGEYLQEMKEEVIKSGYNKNVIFTGYRSDIYNILQASDVFVMCSFHETLCNSVIEACRSGLPIIASNVGGIPEMVTDNVNGYLVSEHNINDYIVKINKLIENKSLRENMGKHSLDIFSQNFNETQIIDRIDYIYQGILNGDIDEKSDQRR